ncbi:acetyltransferase [Hydrogenophaga crassostreae]|uniref:Probable alginate O-acetylase AlgI n=1 Tax=Hydrogenophaga crassostreae TaxID=1763535 RepID=A0A162Z0Y3_9BURK|nr:MBOAT family O-acyltransferase [Hydrogenophaga crassostreae]AOW13103.1 membrane-bound O-acyltransferase family protein [Hydrogenophaga crassostreae]OAD42751.1 acetyltransferase [Hydrogenophaga crassostreae]
MIFSSWQFILLFLPVTFGIYFALNRKRCLLGGKLWLVLASLFFYAYWNWTHLPLILLSIGFNFAIGSHLSRASSQAVVNGSGAGIRYRRAMLVFGISTNLAMLAYYKYANFFVANLNLINGLEIGLNEIALPLAVSFFTFTQIVYLVDSFRGETSQYDLLNYSLFVTFFPHLIAGPIVQHSQIMPQFSSRWTWVPRESNILKGLFIFSIGLVKKLVIADTFAVWADAGFDGRGDLDFYSAWISSLSYTLQLYFDFSGYCDMAIGISLLFNIVLPINFNSPYKALNIQDFWRRWHITLSNFLRNFLYIPLGGNRNGAGFTAVNLMITFALGGLWHGASWMFVIWGLLHGSALVVHRVWQTTRVKIPVWMAWLLTFLFVNFSWVFFRAKDGTSARRMLDGMINWKSMGFIPVENIPSTGLARTGWMADHLLWLFPSHLVAQLPAGLMLVFGFFLLCRKNTMELAVGEMNTLKMSITVVFLALSVCLALISTSAVFLYFNF